MNGLDRDVGSRYRSRIAASYTSNQTAGRVERVPKRRDIRAEDDACKRPVGRPVRRKSGCSTTLVDRAPQLPDVDAAHGRDLSLDGLVGEKLCTHGGERER